MQRQRQEVNEAIGVIVLVQEDRFRLETLDGRSLLLVLGPDAGSSLGELESLADSRRVVAVRYQGEPDAGAVALGIHPE